MLAEIIYAISNSSMHLFSNNTKTRFRNKFPKELSVFNRVDNSLWISVENIVMENTVTNYRKKSKLPEIIFTSDKTDQSRMFHMSERHFKTDKSVELF